jgi:hypothetical protein
VTPLQDAQGTTTGAVLAFHLFNNDFTLVDRIKNVAGIDTATIFFGDLRVSTNVMTADGDRAIGTGSDEVSQVVLTGGKEFVGPAFVVNENYITRYDPITNHQGDPVGIIYVGAKQASFYQLVDILNQRILFVAIGTIFATFVLAIYVARVTRPQSAQGSGSQPAGGRVGICPFGTDRGRRRSGLLASCSTQWWIPHKVLRTNWCSRKTFSQWLRVAHELNNLRHHPAVLRSG